MNEKNTSNFNRTFSVNWLCTVVKLIDPSEKYTPYAGAAYDLEMAQKWGLPILDLPLSFLLDTALLPYAWSN